MEEPRQEQCAIPTFDPGSSERQVIILLGDSILDNQPYVARFQPSVITQLRRKIRHRGEPWEARRRAVDGATIGNVIMDQIPHIPEDATILVLSAGGNDGLRFLNDHWAEMMNPCRWFSLLSQFTELFSEGYAQMAERIREKADALGAKVAVCTIYVPRWRFPFVSMLTSVAIRYMNSVIKREAKKHGFDVIDVYSLFSEAKDYANPIEPSIYGGDKITHNIINLVSFHGMGGSGFVYAENGYHQEECRDPIEGEDTKLTIENGAQTAIIAMRSLSEDGLTLWEKSRLRELEDRQHARLRELEDRQLGTEDNEMFRKL